MKRAEEMEKEEREMFENNTILEIEQEKSFLIGNSIIWNSISEEDNKKEWIWENYIAKGNVTLLSALWKAGKTTFLRCLFVAIHKEEEFAGQPTKKSKILVISEESKGEWVSGREELTDEETEDVLVWSRPIRIKPNLKQWTTLCEEISEKCKKEKVDMVVIDTLTTFWPIDNENDSAQVIKALVPLYNFTENNIAVLLVHHFRKGGGDQGQASRGSGALPGFVDNIIEFTRVQDGVRTQRILKTYGRFDEVIPEVVINYQPDGKYKTLGEPWKVSKSARIEKILNIFRENKKEMSAKEVYNVWITTDPDISVRSIQRYVKELATDNILKVVKIDTVVSKKTPFYALNDGFGEQTTIPDTAPEIPVVSSATDDKSLNGAVASNGHFEAKACDTTGTSVIPVDNPLNADFWNK